MNLSNRVDHVTIILMSVALCIAVYLSLYRSWGNKNRTWHLHNFPLYHKTYCPKVVIKTGGVWCPGAELSPQLLLMVETLSHPTGGALRCTLGSEKLAIRELFLFKEVGCMGRNFQERVKRYSILHRKCDNTKNFRISGSVRLPKGDTITELNILMKD